MRGLLLTLGLLFSLTALAQQTTEPSQPTLELKDGDRIVFLGSNFFEREYRFGLIETAITVTHPDKNLTFRNLGWSGDNVWGEARAYFDEPIDGYNNLIQSVKDAQPTVIFLAYGYNESFAGPQGLPAFTEQYNKLLEDLKQITDRIVIFTPQPQEAVTSPVSVAVVQQNNTNIKLYADAIVSAAESHNLLFFDVYERLVAHYELVEEEKQRKAFPEQLFSHATIDGTQLNEHGYTYISLGIVSVFFDRQAEEKLFNYISNYDPSQSPIAQAIREKNQLFFHSWRPANITYLTLFRKHEQGNNAVEVEQFKPLIEQAERHIADLRAQLNSASNQPANNGN